MPRSPRLDFPGACHHVTARGNRGQGIFLDAEDSQAFLALLKEARDRFGWQVLAYCLMPDHYHLAVETPEGGLARGMRHLNGTYTQAMNRKCQTRGHLFEGRYKAVLIDREAYLADLIRYIALSPVRANLAGRAEIWRWGSYREIVSERTSATSGVVSSERVLSLFGREADAARRALRAFVEEGTTQDAKVAAFEKDLWQQSVLGSEKFVASVSQLLGGSQPIPSMQAPQVPLSEYLHAQAEPKDAMAKAYLEGGHTLRSIADAFGVHESTVSRAVKKAGSSPAH